MYQLKQLVKQHNIEVNKNDRMLKEYKQTKRQKHNHVNSSGFLTYDALGKNKLNGIKKYLVYWKYLIRFINIDLIYQYIICYRYVDHNIFLLLFMKILHINFFG